MAVPSPSTTFSALYDHILTLPPPLLPPPKPTLAPLTATISSLFLHPTLEAALHILNNDLPSAHFLVRHMQAAPAYEGMFLHGILHRIEGDYDNARAWYGNVKDSEAFGKAWNSEEQAREFIGNVEALVKRKDGNEEELQKESVREIKAVVQYCREKFGDGEVKDATGAWVQPSDEHKKMQEEMVTGGKGYRQF
ncbi:hypothetical protein ACLMJK_007548 [Lecanora helva]